MPATNFILAVYQQILALLGANVRVAAALKAGNTVREDQGKFQPRDARGAKNAVDFPRVYLRQRGFELVAGSQSPDGEELGVFAEEATGFTPSTGDWEEKIGQPFDVKIVHDGLDLAAASAFELDVVEALRDGGTKLGLDYVIGWSYAAQSIETDRDADAPGRMRRVTTITLTVQMHLHGSELAFHSPAGVWLSSLDATNATIIIYDNATNGVYTASIQFGGQGATLFDPITLCRTSPSGSQSIVIVQNNGAFPPAGFAVGWKVSYFGQVQTVMSWTQGAFEVGIDAPMTAPLEGGNDVFFAANAGQNGTWDSATDALALNSINGTWNRATGVIDWGVGWLFTNQVEAPLS